MNIFEKLNKKIDRQIKIISGIIECGICFSVAKLR